MAGYPFDPSYTGAPLFDIYNDPTAALPRGNVLSPSLPGGGCNYVDLNLGPNGAKCGCRRFWIRSAVGSPTVDGAGWCMCNHHACYHDDGPRDSASTPAPIVEHRGPGQENERPRSGREPLSPMVGLSLQMPPPNNHGSDLPIYPVEDPLSFIYNDPGFIAPDQARISTQTPQPPPGSLPDTLAWDTAQTQPQSHRPAPLTSQGLAPSQATSTTSSVRAKYARPFAGKGLDTLVPQSKHRESSQILPGKSVFAPLPKGFDQVDESFVVAAPQDPGSSTLQPEMDTQADPRMFSEEGVSKEAFKNLSETVGGHEQRLDRLENASFSAPGHEECHEKHDHADIRIADLESRMEEVERANSDQATTITRLTATTNDEASTQSVASFSTNGTTRPTHSQEIYSQLQLLQAQVDSLQSALPTFSHPWEVEVVFLPFPLKKVWQEIGQFKNDVGSTGDDWTQLPATYSSRTMRSQSPFDWAAPDHDAEWLLPRAWSDKSVVEKRLRSRGLIRKVSVKGSDARSVRVAINSVFGETWKEMELAASADLSGSKYSRFLGLRSVWVPLRKIHKDSRLRFLSPAEMLNPTLWDVQFLNSVMMRSSEPRLFITHPDAYLQDYQAYEAGWTWQKVRQLTRVYPGLTESQEVPEADAHEEHWRWNEQLDEAPDANTSMSLRNERQLSLKSPAQYECYQGPSWRSASPAVASGQPSFLRDRRGSQLPHIRTASVPLGTPGRPSPALSRRRVVSYGQSRRSSPSVRSSQFAVMKNRRRTRSPSYPRHTPRWTVSPSPMPPGITDRQQVRGTTPFAYATPHSNVPLQEVRTIRASSAAPIPPEFMVDMDHENDELFEIEIYESESEGSYGDEEDVPDALHEIDIMTHAQVFRDSQSGQLPEDEPWPGIEDQEHMSDGENVDPNTRHSGQNSQASSQPSEYPSTQRAWPDDIDSGFEIHEDE